MLRINLLPPQLRPKLVINLDLIFLITFCASLIFVAVSFASVQSKLKKNQNEYSRLENEATDQRKLIEQLRAKENTRDMSATQALVAKRKKWNLFIKELTYIIPPDVWVTKLKLTSSADSVGMEFSGLAPSQKSVNRFFSRMERSPSFQTVKLTASKAKTDFTPALYAFDFAVPDVFQTGARGPASTGEQKK